MVSAYPIPNMFSKRLALIALASSLFVGPVVSTAETDYNKVGQVVSTMLRNLHFSKQPWDVKLSNRVLDDYLNALDFQKLYFTQADVDAITKKYGDTLYLDLQNGDCMAPAKEIFDLYLQKVTARHLWMEKFLKEQKMTFDSTRKVEISREKAAWPKDAAEADQLWALRLEESLLRERMRADEVAAKAAGKTTDDKKPAAVKTETESPEQKILKRYKRVLENVRETNTEEICDFMLSALTACYDPHTEYFSFSEEEQFQTSMQNSLIGIGALLQADDDGTTQIKGIVEKGPADKSGKIQLDDRVIAVDTNNSGEMVDIMYMKINKVVELIRGKDGSEVRLKIIPADAPTTTREIIIKREKVELKDQLVTGQIIRRKQADGTTANIGWLDVPSFYADLNEGKTGVSRDVRRVLARMIKEGIDGLVVDLRGNGGGSLDEAIKMTGLFIKEGPVVQLKDANKRIEVKDSRAPEPMYNGPLVVLTDKTSASASEIFAAALQDYHRALVVGDKSTFGKGTVQTVAPVGRAMPLFSDNERAGSLKVTNQKFYRIAGGSTQFKGVVPDIILPSRIDALKIGEDALKCPLPYDAIPSRDYEKYDAAALHIAELSKRSADRVAKDSEYKYIVEDVARLKEQIERNTLSLNITERAKERDENEAREKQRNAARKEVFAAMKKSEEAGTRIYKITLDNAEADKLEEQKDFSNKDTTMRRSETDEDGEIIDDSKMPEYPFGFDPLKREALGIAGDLIGVAAKSSPAAVKVP